MKVVLSDLQLDLQLVPRLVILAYDALGRNQDVGVRMLVAISVSLVVLLPHVVLL